MSFIKNLSDSLIHKTLPDVSRQIFPSETDRLSSFQEKLETARGLISKAKDNVVATAEPLQGATNIGKRISKQIRTGKFGMTSEEKDDILMKSMGFDFGNDGFSFDDMGDSPSSSDSSSSSSSFSGGNSIDASSTDNSKHYIDNRVMNVNGMVGHGLTDGDVLINERMAVNGAQAAQADARMIGLMSRMAASLDTVTDILSKNTLSFYEASMDHYKIQASLASNLEAGLANVYWYYKEQKEKADSERAKRLGLNVTEENVLDPARAVKKMTGGVFEQLFGEDGNSPIKAMAENFASDPLGTALGAALGAGIGNLFAAQIDWVKDQADSLELRARDTMEKWANAPRGENDALYDIKRYLGQTLGMTRSTDTRVNFGGYSTEATPFDQQTRKSIVDVIPMFLSKILKAVSGSQTHTVYDWEAGRFSTDREMNKKTVERLRHINDGMGFSGLGGSLKGNVKSLNTLTEDEKKQLTRRIQKHALDKNSASFDVTKLDLGSEKLNSAYDQMISGMDREGLLNYRKAFRNHRYSRMAELEKFRKNTKSTGYDAALILSGKENFGINKEHNGFGAPLRNINRDANKDAVQAEEERNDPRNRTSIERFFDKFSKLMDDSKAKVGGFAKLFKESFIKNIVNPFKGAVGTGDRETNIGKGIFTNIMDRIDKSVLFPLKSMLLGGDHKVKNFTIFEAISRRMERSVLIPFKQALLGKDANLRTVASTSLMESISFRMEESIFRPLRTKLVGADRADEMGMFKALYTRFDESVLFPIKKVLLGKDVDDKTVAETGLFRSLYTRFDNSVLYPLKKLMIGNDADDATIRNTTFFRAASDRFNESILTPLKHTLLGKESYTREEAAGTGLFKSIGTRIDKSILMPMKTALFGGNENKAQNKNIFEAIGFRLERSVFFPLKRALLGGEERSAREVKNTSLIKAMYTGYVEKIVQPLSAMLFGEEKRKNGFFNNLGSVLSPFFNKLLFGQEQASKGGLWQNIKSKGKELWSSVWTGVKDNFLKPAVGALKDFFGPTLKDFAGTVADEFKYFAKNSLSALGKTITGATSGGIKAGAKNLFKNVFGDETVQLLRDNVIKPMRDLTDKLTENVTKIFKFLIRAPINFLRGITDTMKISRMNSGRGNYSEDEIKRLRGLEASGKVFNFTDLGKTTKSDTKESNKKKSGFMSRVFKGRDKAANDRNGSSNDVKLDRINVDPATVATSQLRASSQLEVSSVNLDRSSNILQDAAAKLIEGVKRLRGGSSKNGGSDVDLESQSLEPIGFAGGSTGTLVTTSASNAANVSTSKTLEILSPTLILGANAQVGLYDFAKSNLTKLDARIESLVRLMRKQHGDATGYKGSTSIFRNPVQWLSGKIIGTFGVFTSILGAMGKTVGSVTKALVEIPGKIAGSVGNLLSAIVNAAAKGAEGLIKIASGAFEVVATGAKGIAKGLGSVISGLGEASGKLISGLASATGTLISGAANFVANVAGPMASAIGNVTVALANGLAPVVQSAGKALGGFINVVGNATVGLAKLATETVLAVGRGVANIATGGRYGGSVKFVGGVKVVNFADMFAAGAASPMRVHVVDGKVETYTKKKRKPIRETTFSNIDEARSLLGNHPTEDKKDKKKKGLSDLLGGLMAAGGLAKGVGGVVGGALKVIGGLLPLLITGLAKVFGGLGAVAANLVRNTWELIRGRRKGKGGVVGGVDVPDKHGKQKGGTLTTVPNMPDKKPSKLGKITGIASIAAVGAEGVSLANSQSNDKKPTTLGKISSIMPLDSNVGSLSPMGGALSTVPSANSAPAKTSMFDKALSFVGLGRNKSAEVATENAVKSAKYSADAARASSMAASSVADPKKGILSRVGDLFGKIGGRGAAAGAAGKAGLMTRAGGALVNAGKSFSLKGLGKGLGAGALIGIGGNFAADMMFDKGTAAHDYTSTASTYAGVGAAVGSLFPVVGTAVGAIIGGLVGVVKESVPRLISWVEDKFHDQIRDATEYFIQIPERITAFADELPEKISQFAAELPEKLTGWMDSLPARIQSWFVSDDLSVGEDGIMGEEKPSILGRMFSALGSAAWSVARAIPKIAVSLLEGVVKTSIGLGVSAVAGAGKMIYTSITGLGSAISNMVSKAVVWGRNKLSFIPGIGLSDKEAAEEYKKIDEKSAEDAKKRSEYLERSTERASAVSKALTTTWSIADLMPTSDGNRASTTVRKNAYTEALANSNGDRNVALAKFSESTGLSGDSAKSAFDRQEFENNWRTNRSAYAKDSVANEASAVSSINGSVTEGTQFIDDPNQPGGKVYSYATNNIADINYNNAVQQAQMMNSGMGAMAAQNVIQASNVINPEYSIRQQNQVDPLMAQYNGQGVQYNPNTMGSMLGATTVMTTGNQQAGQMIGQGGGIPYAATFAGAGGSYSGVPAPRGKGWNNTRDTILKASSIVGVDPALMAGVAAVESGFNPAAKARSSSASGLFQFIDGTWKAMLERHGGKYGIPAGTSPFDGAANSLMGAAYIRANALALSQVKRNVSPTDVYMAHFMGTGGARRFLSAMNSNPGASAASLFPSQARANPTIFYNGFAPRSLAGVYQLLDNKLRTRATQYGVNLGNLGAPATSTQVMQGNMAYNAEMAQVPNNAVDPSADNIIKQHAVVKSGINTTGLNPTFKTALSRALMEYYQRTGKKATINSGYRSLEEQAYLYRTMKKGMAARPGSSLHNFGFAVDINSNNANEMASLGILAKYGLERPLPSEKWHIQPVGITKDMAKKGIISADAPIHQNGVNQAGTDSLAMFAQKDPNGFNDANGIKGLTPEEAAQSQKMLDAYFGGISAIGHSLNGDSSYDISGAKKPGSAEGYYGGETKPTKELKNTAVTETTKTIKAATTAKTSKDVSAQSGTSYSAHTAPAKNVFATGNHANAVQSNAVTNNNTSYVTNSNNYSTASTSAASVTKPTTSSGTNTAPSYLLKPATTTATATPAPKVDVKTKLNVDANKMLNDAQNKVNAKVANAKAKADANAAKSSAIVTVGALSGAANAAANANTTPAVDASVTQDTMTQPVTGNVDGMAQPEAPLTQDQMIQSGADSYIAAMEGWGNLSSDKAASKTAIATTPKAPTTSAPSSPKVSSEKNAKVNAKTNKEVSTTAHKTNSNGTAVSEEILGRLHSIGKQRFEASKYDIIQDVMKSKTFKNEADVDANLHGIVGSLLREGISLDAKRVHAMMFMEGDEEPSVTSAKKGTAISLKTNSSDTAVAGEIINRLQSIGKQRFEASKYDIIQDVMKTKTFKNEADVEDKLHVIVSSLLREGVSVDANRIRSMMFMEGDSDASVTSPTVTNAKKGTAISIKTNSNGTAVSGEILNRLQSIGKQRFEASKYDIIQDVMKSKTFKDEADVDANLHGIVSSLLREGVSVDAKRIHAMMFMEGDAEQTTSSPTVKGGTKPSMNGRTLVPFALNEPKSMAQYNANIDTFNGKSLNAASVSLMDAGSLASDSASGSTLSVGKQSPKSATNVTRLDTGSLASDSAPVSTSTVNHSSNSVSMKSGSNSTAQATTNVNRLSQTKADASIISAAPLQQAQAKAETPATKEDVIQSTITELRAQTKLLEDMLAANRETASNTAKGVKAAEVANTNTANFFATGKAQQNEFAEQHAKMQLEAKMSHMVAGNVTPFPSYMNPSANAVQVSKGGSH